MELKNEKLEPIFTGDFYYDLFVGGYINPANFLDEESAEKVIKAINIIEEFESLLTNNNLIEEL